MRLSDFDYHLPKELIAQYPLVRRQDSRLLVLERAKKRIRHGHFQDILDYLLPGDCLVLNNTRVICARLIGRRQSTAGGRQEVFFQEDLSDNTYRVLARPAKKLTTGMKIVFNNGSSSATVLSDQGMSKIVKFSGRDIWREFGRVPLPPYIKREPVESDAERYQTVYAEVEGATAAPTAGLHFTKEVLEDIRAKGVNVVYLTLHINYGTFAPVKSEDLSRHKMHKEYFILPEETKKTINATRRQGGRVLAVGTTSVRVLESASGREGWTDLFIYPPYDFKAVDCLLTNFHFPKSTLLMLVSAFAGKELLFEAYRQAIERKYRFFSYGDAMLII
ncbi:MAG: tRNA preQ1(34) S-adenosylmethionine ribosyltransferase-isomerase QueA [Candidatus Omnitrophota bacterium]|nr:MAG: tRNA preQ1(34) S-adenosylmethionine ribosyltransferase-isomerase QueA [Candidatus Omnitrophota bacterium]